MVEIIRCVGSSFSMVTQGTGRKGFPRFNRVLENPKCVGILNGCLPSQSILLETKECYPRLYGGGLPIITAE